MVKSTAFDQPEKAVMLEDSRQSARQKSLFYPLQWLAEDFRSQIRDGLHARGHLLETSFASVIINLDIHGSRLTTLAQRADMTKQAMGKLVDQLESVGYVYRCADPLDGRAKIVCFTSEGHKLLHDSSQIVDGIWNEYASLIGKQELEDLQKKIEQMLRQIKRHRCANNSFDDTSFEGTCIDDNKQNTQEAS